VKLPPDWLTRDVTLALEKVEDAHEVFVNGAKVGGAGRFPPNYQSGFDTANRYVVPSEKLRPGEWNLIAVRTYHHQSRVASERDPPAIGTDKHHISLAGSWQFRIGDDPSWAISAVGATNHSPSAATFSKLEEGPVARGSGGHKMSPRANPLSLAESARSFTVPDDLEIEQVLAEPIVRQPVFVSFDERGRMWVVQYLQYPAPAGLKVVSKDIFWRAVYDKVPPPPPHGVKGLDRITIHEDTDGDGIFDKHKVFIDGLNIATACVKGRGGVWVLNPPYLLFYPDSNDDDIPDGDPVVHLEGFGLEDTHSVVNSLRWGPDGWLYAAQGSTVTANVRVRAGNAAREKLSLPSNAPPVQYSQGQNIWRYHPETHRYEVFAEGGGNAFGVEIDEKGRIFSGHNGGDTRGFHYMQGAYLRKGFEKHGELSNPYAFGYFPQMTGTPGERFTHTFIIYQGGALPARYEGKLFGVEPLQGRVVLSEITPEGSTFKTRDIERVVTSNDSWFRPVDIKVGPDGAIYICDWYDRQVTHTRSQEGNVDPSNGRIYRLKAKGAGPAKPLDLGRLSSEQLIPLLSHTNQWVRQTALRLLGDRHDPALASKLEKLVFDSPAPLALEALWALNLTTAQTAPANSVGATPNNPFALREETLLFKLLDHRDSQVRLWTIRLLGDDGDVSSVLAKRLAEVAARESDVEVRAQLACTAKRLPTSAALPIVANLLRHDEDATEPRLPLLCWWALEAECGSDREAVLKLFEDSPFWSEPMVEQQILERVMRRFAAAGTRRDLLTCARLLQLSPSREHSVKLMKGFEEAFKGRSLAGLPDEVIQATARHHVGSDAFRLRQENPEAIAEALRTIADPGTRKERRLEFVAILGEVKQTSGVPVLLRIVSEEHDNALRKAALTALLQYDASGIGAEVVRAYSQLPPEVRSAAQTLLASRANWSLQLVEAVEARFINPADVPPDIVRRMKLHKSERLVALISKQWPQTGVATTQAMQRQVQRLTAVLRSGKGDPYRGQKLFNGTCASCHTLFARGGKVGPDLTTYQRGDVETMLLHIVNPSAEIREGYENMLIETKDDRSLNGFLVERDANVVVLRGPDGQNVALQQKEIVEMRAAGLSLMPEGLLDNLDEQQVRDLFAYLRSTQPLAN
jgi:putative membrane-bound dehydrogenase-like protein